MIRINDRGARRRLWSRAPGLGAIAAVAGALILLPPGSPAAVASTSAFPVGGGTGATFCASAVPSIGFPLGGNFDDIYACGPEPGLSAPSYGDPPFQYGGGFQCTELANRYLGYREGYTVADDTFNGDNLVGGNFVATVNNLHPGLAVGTSGSGALPETGDIISMWRSTSGDGQSGGDTHVGIVTGVTGDATSGWSIGVLSENDTSGPASGENAISVSPSGSWSWNGGFYSSFDWLEMPLSTPSVPAPSLSAPDNVSISPGAVVAFPGSAPTPFGTGDTVTMSDASGGSAPVDLLHWGASGVIVQIPASTAPGSYTLTAADSGGSSQVPFTVVAAGDPKQQITPLGSGASSSLPLGIAESQSGAVWFSDAASNSLGELLPSGAVQEYPLQVTGSDPTGVAVDQAGNVWVADNGTGQVTELNPTLATAGTSAGETTYTLAAGATPDQLTVDPYGNVWVAEGDGVLGEITASSPGGSRVLKEWLVGSDLEGMAIDSFGNVWAVDEGTGVLEIVPSQLPAPSTTAQASTGVYVVAPGGGTEQIAVAPNGDVWFTQWGPPVLGLIVPSPDGPSSNQVFTAANYPSSGGAPSGVGIDAAGNVFVEDAASQAVYEFAPGATDAASGTVAGSWTSYPVGTWITNYPEGDEGNNLVVTPSGSVVLSGYATNGGNDGTPYGSTNFVQGFLDTLPGVGVASSSRGALVDGTTTTTVTAGTSGDSVTIPGGTTVTTSAGTPFDGTILPPVADPTFVPPATFGTTVSGGAFAVTPALLDGLTTHVVFSAPVTITFSFPLPSGVTAAEAEAATIWTYDPSTYSWSEAGLRSGDPGGTISVSGGTVTVTLRTMHLSSFAALTHASSAPALTGATPDPVAAGGTVTMAGSALGSAPGEVILTPSGGSSEAAVPLTITSWTATSVVAAIPSGEASGLYTISTVTSAGATSNSVALQVAGSSPGSGGSGGGGTGGGPPISPPGPVVAAVAPSSGPIAGGTRVTITGSDLAGVTAVSFGGVAATSFEVTSAQAVTAVAPPHAAGVVDIQVSGSDGFSLLTDADQFTYTAASPPGQVATRVYVTPPTQRGPGEVVVRVTTNAPGAVIHLFDQYAGAHSYLQKALHVAVRAEFGNGVWVFEVPDVRATNHFYAVVDGVRSNVVAAPLRRRN